MSYDPLKRDSSWQMILPGCYIDQAGCGHFFPDELLAFLSAAHPEVGFDPNSKTHYDMVVKICAEQLQQICPGVGIVIAKHEREKN